MSRDNRRWVALHDEQQPNRKSYALQVRLYGSWITAMLLEPGRVKGAWTAHGSGRRDSYDGYDHYDRESGTIEEIQAQCEANYEEFLLSEIEYWQHILADYNE